MGKLLMVIYILGLLMIAATYGVAGNLLHDDIEMLWELENLEIVEDEEVELFDIPAWISGRGNKVLVNVDSFGAVGDGVSDDTQVHIILIFYSQH